MIKLGRSMHHSSVVLRCLSLPQRKRHGMLNQPETMFCHTVLPELGQAQAAQSNVTTVLPEPAQAQAAQCDASLIYYTVLPELAQAQAAQCGTTMTQIAS